MTGRTALVYLLTPPQLAMAAAAALETSTERVYRRWSFVIVVCLFVCSGTMQPLLISTLGYNGAYDKSTLLFLLPNYVGMLASSYMPVRPSTASEA